MNRHLGVVAILAVTVALLTLSACDVLAGTPAAPGSGYLLPMSSETSSPVPCEACAQATLAVALTQEKNNADNQAAATAEIVRANAQATLNSANATLSAAQTQDQNNANVIAAQIAGTSEIVRANAQATLNSAGSTQSAALTQDAIHQTQTADLATTGAEAVMTQQNKNDLAASTQTAVANNIATQTQAAAAISQWYIDQTRQREEQRQGQISSVWMWFLPVFTVLLAGLALGGFLRWLKIQQANQRILENPVAKLQAPVNPGELQDKFLQPSSNIVNGRYRLTQPDDQMRGWLDEIKRKLLNREKDKDDNSDS
jgi:hypothetical protein